MMLRAFRRHLFSYIEVMVGSVVLVMRWAILTTLCSDFLSLMVQLPYQTVMQVGRMLSMVQQSGKSSAALGGDRWTLANFLRKNMRLCAFLIRVVMLGVQERSSEMWTPRNLKLVTRSTSSPFIWTGRCVPILFLLESRMISLVVLVLRARLLLLHHSARCRTSSLYADSLFSH